VNDEFDTGQNQDILSRWANTTSISAVQFDAIQRAAARDKVAFETVSFDPGRADGPPLYIWQKDHILVRGQVNEKTNDELARLGAVVADRVDGRQQLVGENRATLLRLTSNRDSEPTSQIAARLNATDELKGRVSVNNLVYVTHADGANLCPADEPIPCPPFPKTIPNPPVSLGDAGRGVRITVIDTGMPQDWRINLNVPWFGLPTNEVDGDDEIETYIDPVTGAIAPHAGHGVFIAGLIRCVAPRATVYVKNTMRWAGSMHEHEVAQTILDVLDEDPPDIISFSAGYMIHEALGGAPGPMLDVMRRLGQEGCRTLLVAATGNDGHGPADHGLFYPAAFAGEEQHAGLVVAVGALREDRRGRACFSNYGDWVTVYEEGEKLINAFPFGRYTYREPVSKDTPPRCTYYHPPIEPGCTCVTAPERFSVATFEGMAAWSGTSFATPIVAARIARHLTENPELAGHPRDAAKDLFKQLVEITDAGDNMTALPVFPTRAVG
jgi:hypothetical protein